MSIALNSLRELLLQVFSIENGGSVNAVAAVLLSSVTFATVNAVLRWLTPRSLLHQKSSSPQHQTNAVWKWRNVATSLVHAAISGAWTLATFYRAPYMWDDLIRSINPMTHSLVSLSVGYFAYDAVDMLVNHRKRSTYELLIHHGLVITCYTIAIATKLYVPYVAWSLMVEINSVFLHARQLIIITGETERTALKYRLVALLNVTTFAVFRVGLFGAMTAWLVRHSHEVATPFFVIGSTCLFGTMSMNSVLLWRIISADFLSKARSGKKGHKADSTTKDKLVSKATPNNQTVLESIQDYANSVFEEEDRVKED